MDETDLADDRFRQWLRGNLGRAADQFGLVLGDAPVHYGWRLRSASTQTVDADGVARWLRVGTELDRWVHDPDVGAFWTGIPDSESVHGVPRPRVLGSAEWTTTDWAPDGQRRCVRADVTTVVPGATCSSTDELCDPVSLPDTWWETLRDSMRAIERTRTSRFARRAVNGGSRVRQVFGDEVADAFVPVEFATQHGDLHWANVVAPECGVLDWELWGVAPVGLDAATLYLFSLRVPEVAERVWAEFAEVLDSSAGHVALVAIAARILHHANQGEYADLAPLILQRVRPLTA